MELTIIAVAAVVAIVAVAAVSQRIAVAAPLSMVVVGIALSFLPGLPKIEIDPEWIPAEELGASGVLSRPGNRPYDDDVLDRVREAALARASLTEAAEPDTMSPRDQYRHLMLRILAAERAELLAARSAGRYRSRTLTRAQRALDLWKPPSSRSRTPRIRSYPETPNGLSGRALSGHPSGAGTPSRPASGGRTRRRRAWPRCPARRPSAAAGRPPSRSAGSGRPGRAAPRS